MIELKHNWLKSLRVTSQTGRSTLASKQRQRNVAGVGHPPGAPEGSDTFHCRLSAFGSDMQMMLKRHSE
jgi:hypothetical protein